MVVSRHPEALGLLADLSVSEEFCQKIGGRVFGHGGEATPLYRELCGQFVCLIDDMIDDLHALKVYIPGTTPPTDATAKAPERETAIPFGEKRPAP